MYKYSFLPAGIGIGSPSSANPIKFLVDSKIVEFEVMFQSVCHGNTGRASADNDGIQLFRIFGHFSSEIFLHSNFKIPNFKNFEWTTNKMGYIGRLGSAVV